MDRRELLHALGLCALAAPLGSFAQQQRKVRRIGFLWENPPTYYVRRFEAFKAGMRELGYNEGRDYAIEQRSAQSDSARLPAAASELLALKVDIIVSSGTPSAEAARKATRDIPILITTAGDPVGSGLAAALSHPGGNITGLTSITTELHTKRLDLLRQILPGLRRVGFLYNPDNGSDVLGLGRFESDCSKLHVTPIRAPVRKVEDISAAFRTLQHDKAQGLIVSEASTNSAGAQTIIEHAATHRLPAVYPSSSYPEAGGLFSYGVNNVDLYRRAATYVDKILKGAKPGDLPIEQPIKFETVLNRKTAKALAMTIPEAILVQANRVIE